MHLHPVTMQTVPGQNAGSSIEFLRKTRGELQWEVIGAFSLSANSFGD